MTAGTWGDRAFPPGYIPDREVRDWINRPPVDLDAVKRRLQAEGVFGTMTTSNGVEISGPPGLMAALADVKPLPWKWIGFGALIVAMGWWVLSA
ncbi:hypothetical protein HOV35_gp51 [Escherichia phage Sortsne]|uniref:Uncharacterized protein n=1 Tax=Escherichia phage Sortsne TaxID=2562456 RepID=A0A4D6E0L1_9CAUD|nr:hypothetical protein HOV35_gp51 [Escherichia phage Sortsne]QBZ71616.1 hypothetical protein [Escherichia phage Sortsne]